ncbi:hypothetical protein L596_024354 [Steinernema carpocapsae]|uniref:Uncharacterized protein n=1 Tax=Steinernema carpocapsae TaxID=34508 RepID=A0A4U5MH85_STECR|nr:hypothetical protein L596_024354 [Steinernema carpocapsae]
MTSLDSPFAWALEAADLEDSKGRPGEEQLPAKRRNSALRNLSELSIVKDVQTMMMSMSKSSHKLQTHKADESINELQMGRVCDETL